MDLLEMLEQHSTESEEPAMPLVAEVVCQTYRGELNLTARTLRQCALLLEVCSNVLHSFRKLGGDAEWTGKAEEFESSLREAIKTLENQAKRAISLSRKLGCCSGRG